MSTRERLGLLLPLPALLAAEPASARTPPAAPPVSEAPGAEAAAPGASEVAAPGAEGSPAGPVAPAEAPAEDEPAGAPSDEPVPPPRWAEAPPLPEEVPVRALFGQGQQAFERGDHRAAGESFEQAATQAPDLVMLSLDATIMFRLAATGESHPEPAAQMCEATRRNAAAVMGHPAATPAQRERARAEAEQADAHCHALTEAQSLSEIEVEVGPCLVPPPPDPRGCAARREPMAMLGSLLLLGLHARRRREAVARVADRLPPDVAARLRRRTRVDAGPDPDDPAGPSDPE